MGRNGFSLNFLTSFSEGASWCFLPVSLFTANSLFNWGMRVVMVYVKHASKLPLLKSKESWRGNGILPVSTQIHPLQVCHYFWVAFFPATFCTLPLFHQPWHLLTRREQSAILDEYKLPCTVV